LFGVKKSPGAHLHDMCCSPYSSIKATAWGQRTYRRYVAAAQWTTCTLHLHCGQHYKETLPVVQLHVMHYSPGHHTVLSLPHWITLHGALSRDGWLHTTTATAWSCTQPWNRQSP